MPRTGLGNRGEEERRRRWGAPPRRCPPGTAADPCSAQRQPGRIKARSRARGPGWPEQTLEASTSPQQVRQPAQQGTRRRARTYLVGGVSGTDRPPRSGGAAETSPRALRAQAAASSASAAQLRHPDPAGDFHLLPGARGIAQRKWPGRTAVRFLLVPLSLSLPGRRKVALSVPETLDHPHQARAAPSLGRAHARAGSGAQPQQSARRGGKGAAGRGGSAA